MCADATEARLPSFEPLTLESLVCEAGEAVVLVDRDWTARYCNEVYAKNLGLTVQQVIGRTAFEYAPTAFKRSIFYEACEHCMSKMEPVSKIGYSTVLSRWLMVRVFPIRGGVLMLANDASESVVKTYSLAQQAVKDPLTGLGNKLAMEQHADRLLQEHKPFSVLIVGLSRLRDVNDSYGYATGDMVLLEVASVLQTRTQGDELVYRISGDEFAVVREGTADGASERVLEFIETVKRPIVISGVRIVLGACAGTVHSPEDGTEYEVLLKRAGLALRDAKKIGRDGVAAFRGQLELASKTRAVIESELRSVLDGSQFALLVQPKVSLATGQVVGAEALIRWAHPRRGLLSPDVFLGIAQDIDAMQAIDQWVLRQSLKYSSELSSRGIRIPIGINLSVDSLADRFLADRVAAALQAQQVAADLLEVEIPEGALMRDVAASALVLAELHRMGVRISIDDFGTGYSSFAYLAQFPVHALKIDRSFVGEMVTSETSRKIIKGMVRLAHSLALEVVAEGAESEAELDLLRRMKCNSVQGYAIARPMPLNEFEQFVARHPAPASPDPLAL